MYQSIRLFLIQTYNNKGLLIRIKTRWRTGMMVEYALNTFTDGVRIGQVVLCLFDENNRLGDRNFDRVFPDSHHAQ